ncbi:hypothetical protein [Lysinibacillus sp. Bpr_S20]|uniref:hypothetical protein n=1 Tax=Lysinibacillus sp. Bpr_S20 TaxID=2933964 RepID=UPI0020110187|nr:hypothetical protein [Lysinibacillus sp. Bpr_S20]MCL1703050.1 hypothetical protein [Lysinibacillus sp. Bpr_S20]
MTKEEFEEFKSLIAIGEEFNFDFKNDEYWISHNGDKSFLSRTRDHYTQEFNGYEELFEKATIEGIKISELYPNLKW